MYILTVFLYVMIVVVALLLIALILIQPSKSGGMGATFGGIGESVFGGKAGSHLTKTTVVLTTIFFVIALTLAAFIGRGAGMKKTSGLHKELAAVEEKAPAAADAGAQKESAVKTEQGK